MVVERADLCRTQNEWYTRLFDLCHPGEPTKPQQIWDFFMDDSVDTDELEANIDMFNVSFMRGLSDRTPFIEFSPRRGRRDMTETCGKYDDETPPPQHQVMLDELEGDNDQKIFDEWNNDQNNNQTDDKRSRGLQTPGRQNNNQPESKTKVVTPGTSEPVPPHDRRNLCSEYKGSADVMDDLCECSYHKAKREGDLDEFQLKQSAEASGDGFSTPTGQTVKQQSTKWLGHNSDMENLFGDDEDEEKNPIYDDDIDDESIPMCATWDGDWGVVSKFCTCDIHKDLKKSKRNRKKNRARSGETNNNKRKVEVPNLSQLPMGTEDNQALTPSRVKKEPVGYSPWDMVITTKSDRNETTSKN